jgi:hypothetical protein
MSNIDTLESGAVRSGVDCYRGTLWTSTLPRISNNSFRVRLSRAATTPQATSCAKPYGSSNNATRLSRAVKRRSESRSKRVGDRPSAEDSSMETKCSTASTQNSKLRSAPLLSEAFRSHQIGRTGAGSNQELSHTENRTNHHAPGDEGDPDGVEPSEVSRAPTTFARISRADQLNSGRSTPSSSSTILRRSLLRSSECCTAFGTLKRF